MKSPHHTPLHTHFHVEWECPVYSLTADQFSECFWTRLTNASTNVCKKATVSSAVILPSSPHNPATLPIEASGCCTTGILKKARDWRKWWFPPNALRLPGATLMMPAGLLFQTLVSFGREPTSIAFFKTPGTERLYSGVTNKMARSEENTSEHKSR